MHAPAARLLASALALSLLAACSSSPGDDTADATVPTAPPLETTTTAAPDPFAVPEVIDEAYVNRVLAALYRIDGDVLRRVVADGEVPSDARRMLRAMYNDPQFELEFQGTLKTVARGLDRFKRPPGDRKTEVVKLMTARPDCIFVEVTVDFSDVVVSPPAATGDTHFLALQPTQPGADPQEINKTAWSIAYTEIVKKGEAPQEQPCNS